ncbi:hypothetical protein GP486_003235 [Trichoglossum hirsutum]|uniref:Cytochrome P450 n=1 Tax=Trichoglossum hirsutum TaxID=265104 RepID=A0A9P8LDH4_9PEZI|nr:hypothetical protein GP486_003235 [Trichoglossum hirsutum]
MALEFLLRIPVLIQLAILVVCLVRREFKFRRSVPKDLPWVGKRSEWFWRIRSDVRGLFGIGERITKAYHEYSKNGKFFIISDLVTGPEVMVPVSKIPVLLAQPDEVMDTTNTHCDILQSDYTFSHPRIFRNPLQVDVVRKVLTRQIGSLVEPVMDEIAMSFDELWGFDTEGWKEILIDRDMNRVIARTLHRMLLGPDLCKNQEFIDRATTHSRTIIYCAIIIHVIPEFLKPWVQFSRPNRIGMNDFLQWQIRESLGQPDPVEHSPEIIAGRVESVNFSAIHTTQGTAMGVMLDLFSSPPEKGYVEALREEATRVLEEDGGRWTKTGVAKLIRIDSTIKESMRWKGGSARSLTRTVIKRDGFTFEDGVHIPYGFKVGTPQYAIHLDEEFYPNPKLWDPFRFSREREEFEQASRRRRGPAGDDSHADAAEPLEGPGDGNVGILRLRNEAVVSTSEKYIAWGHGRHAW